MVKTAIGAATVSFVPSASPAAMAASAAGAGVNSPCSNSALRTADRWHPEQEDRAEHRECARASALCKRHRRKDRERRPADIHHRREEVVVERKHCDRLHETAVERKHCVQGRGERGEVRVVPARHARAFDETRRECCVVPERIALSNAAAVRHRDMRNPLRANERTAETGRRNFERR
jgi:hypothetical protein